MVGTQLGYTDWQLIGRMLDRTLPKDREHIWIELAEWIPIGSLQMKDEVVAMGLLSVEDPLGACLLREALQSVGQPVRMEKPPEELRLGMDLYSKRADSLVAGW